ncbi:hypothetical protein OHA75_34955 [Streptomyces coelicoflavus]
MSTMFPLHPGDLILTGIPPEWTDRARTSACRAGTRRRGPGRSDRRRHRGGGPEPPRGAMPHGAVRALAGRRVLIPSGRSGRRLPRTPTQWLLSRPAPEGREAQHEDRGHRRYWTDRLAGGREPERGRTPGGTPLAVHGRRRRRR